MGRSDAGKRTLITSGILTENGQVVFNICALIFSSLVKIFSRFRNIFYKKSASFMLSSWFFVDIKFMYDCSAGCLSIKFMLLWKSFLSLVNCLCRLHCIKK